MESQMQSSYALPTSSLYNSYPSHPPQFSSVGGREYVVQQTPYRSIDDFVSRDSLAMDRFVNRDITPASMLDLRAQRSVGVDYSEYANYLLQPSFGFSRISGLPQDIGIRPRIDPVGPSVTGYLQQDVRQPYAARPTEKVIRQLN